MRIIGDMRTNTNCVKIGIESEFSTICLRIIVKMIAKVSGEWLTVMYFTFGGD